MYQLIFHDQSKKTGQGAKIKRRDVRYAGLTVLLMTYLFLALTAYSEAGIGEKVSEKVLPNGLKVILLENHRAPLLTFQVWYRVGSRNEDWGKTGLSHMLEHMMFKGTEKVGPEEFSRIIQENGGNDNAFTSADYTAYFENISADRVQVAIDLEADRMQNLVLNEKDFAPERLVVMEERRMRTEDNPQAYFMEQVEATAFQTSPYHWPTIGWKEDIERFTLDDLKKHYKTYYNPANAFLVVVGDFRKDDLLQRIEKAFGKIPGGTTPDQKRDTDSPQTGERRIIVKREAELPSIVMGYHIPNMSDPDAYALDVAAALLSEGKSSRLYRDLVWEKRLVLDADADNSLLSHDPGLFSLSAELLPGKDIIDVEKALNEEIERLQTKPVTAYELEKAKNQIESAFVFGQDSLFSQAMHLARYEISAGWRKIDDYIATVRKVTADDIKRVSNKYMVPDNRTIGILTPLPSKGKSTTGGSSLKEQIIR